VGRRRKGLVKGLLERIGIEAEVVIVRQERDLLVELKGDRERVLIGKGGRTLEALQTLLNRMINKQHDDRLGFGSTSIIIEKEGPNH